MSIGQTILGLTQAGVNGATASASAANGLVSYYGTPAGQAQVLNTASSALQTASAGLSLLSKAPAVGALGLGTATAAMFNDTAQMWVKLANGEGVNTAEALGYAATCAGFVSSLLTTVPLGGPIGMLAGVALGGASVALTALAVAHEANEEGRANAANALLEARNLFGSIASVTDPLVYQDILDYTADSMNFSDVEGYTENLLPQSMEQWLADNSLPSSDSWYADGPMAEYFNASGQLLQGTDGSDFLAGDGTATAVFGGAGDDVLFGANTNERLFGGVGNDTLYGNGGDDFLSGGKGNDVLFGGDGANTYYWAAGDGMDTIYSSGSADALVLDGVGALSSLTASRNGNDLVLSAVGAGNGGVVLKNWSLGYGRMDITLPDGTTWTAQQIESAFTPAVMGVNFPSGVASASNFAAIVRNQGYEFAGGDNYLSNTFGFNWLGHVWQEGLQYAADTGKTVNGHAVREWGSSMGYTNNAYSYMDPSYSVWSEFTYQFWETDSGSYEFSLVRESAGTGGQTYNYQDTDGDGWTDTWDVVQRNYRLNQSWTPTAYEVSPAVTQVDLLAGPATGSSARGAVVASDAGLDEGMATAVYTRPVAVPEFLATPYNEPLFAADEMSSDMPAYLEQQPNRSVGLAAELGVPSTFFGQDGQESVLVTHLGEVGTDLERWLMASDDTSVDDVAYREAQAVSVYVSAPNDFRLAA